MAKQIKIKGMPIVAEAALRGYLGPRLAADAAINLKPIVKDATGKSWAKDKVIIKTAMDAMIKTGGKDGKSLLAKDADINDLAEMLDTLTPVAEEVAQGIEGDAPAPAPAPAPGEDPAEDGDADMVNRVTEVLTQMGLAPEQIATITAAMKPEVAPEGGAPPKPANDVIPGGPTVPAIKPAVAAKKEDMITKPAMDAAIKTATDATAKTVREETMAVMREISQAERDVAPFIGEVTYAADAAPKTAADVYKLALVGAKVALDGVPPEAFKAMVGMLPKPDATPAGGHGRPKPRVALDSAATTAINTRFPNLARIGKAG
jgi:hypothetical protein